MVQPVQSAIPNSIIYTCLAYRIERVHTAPASTWVLYTTITVRDRVHIRTDRAPVKPCRAGSTCHTTTSAPDKVRIQAAQTGKAHGRWDKEQVIRSDKALMEPWWKGHMLKNDRVHIQQVVPGQVLTTDRCSRRRLPSSDRLNRQQNDCLREQQALDFRSIHIWGLYDTRDLAHRLLSVSLIQKGHQDHLVTQDPRVRTAILAHGALDHSIFLQCQRHSFA